MAKIISDPFCHQNTFYHTNYIAFFFSCLSVKSLDRKAGIYVIYKKISIMSLFSFLEPNIWLNSMKCIKHHNAKYDVFLHLFPWYTRVLEKVHGSWNSCLFGDSFFKSMDIGSLQKVHKKFSYEKTMDLQIFSPK